MTTIDFDDAPHRQMAIDLLREALGESIEQEREKWLLEQFENERQSVTSQISKNGDRAKAIAREYIGRVWEKVDFCLGVDPLMPGCIDYNPVYSSLLQVQDRNKVLRGVKALLDEAEKKITLARGLDPQKAAEKASNSFRCSVRNLSTVPVPDPPTSVVCHVRESDEAPQNLTILEKCLAAVDEAYLKEVSCSSMVERAHEREALKQNVQRANFASGYAVKKVLDSEAGKIAGATLKLDDLPDFAGSIDYYLPGHLNELEDLLQEMYVSFETYSRIVNDNGLFAAFPNSKFGKTAHLSFGALVADRFPDLMDRSVVDFRAPDYYDKRHRPVPEIVVNKSTDYSLSDVCNRMRAFNRIEYDGFLDDDFEIHVLAFWYGFKNLMDYVNQLRYDIDFGPLHEYVKALTEICEERAWNLGASMCSKQLEEWGFLVSKLKTGVNRIVIK